MKKILFLGFLILGLISACDKTDDENINSIVELPKGPQDTVTSLMLTFEDVLDSSAKIVNYFDEDGLGPIKPRIGRITLNANREYLLTLRIEDGTGVPVVLNNKIKTNGKDFKICLSNPLGLIVEPKDSDGTFPIGLENGFKTSSQLGSDVLTLSIKYQKGVKTGSCEPGIVYFNTAFPITIE